MRNTAPLLAAIFIANAALVLATQSPPQAATPSSLVATSPVAALIAQADKFSLALDLDEARARIDEAIALAEKAGDRIGLAMSYRMKGLAFSRLGSADQAATWHARALGAFEALDNRAGMASALTGLTAAASAAGDTAKSREYSERALKLYEGLGDDRGRGFLLSIAVREATTPSLKEASIREILAIAGRLNDDTLRATGLHQLGAHQFAAGDLLSARTSFEGAIAGYEKIGDVDSLAACYLNLGRVFRSHGDYEGALVRYQKAIDLLAPTKERYTIVEALNSSAVALASLNRRQEALVATERAVALARQSGNQRLIDFMEGNLAASLGALGHHERAIAMLQGIIARKPEPYLAPYRYRSLAAELAAVGRPAEALEPINEAIRLTREQEQLEVLPSRLDARSRILSELGRHQEALSDAREAMTLIDQVRTRLIPSDFLKRGYAERVSDHYVRIVDSLSLLGRSGEALEFAEQGRARAFLDLLAARQSADIVLLARGEPSSAAILESSALGQPVKAEGLREIAGRLHSVIITYWVNDDATLIWVVRPGADPVHVRVPVGAKKLRELVAATMAPLQESARSTTTRGAAGPQSPRPSDEDLAALPMRGLGLMALSRDDKSAWRELCKTLIEPVRAQLPVRGSRVTIIPHGPLFQLSFAALRSAAGRYLIEDYELHYAPAISALEFTGRRQSIVATNKGPWAIVGNPAALPLVGDRELPALAGAAQEIDSIAALAPHGSIVRLEGNRASETGLARALETSSPSVLHFATHGFVFADSKLPPFLALHRRGTAEAEDGRLTLDEVYGLRLNADLVVLSACRTGSGNVTSDGVIGLTRGFFYAGTPSVLATFWDVVDESTARLMSGFYRKYVKAGAKGASLRSAQLALLADLRAGKVIVTAGGRKITLPEHPLLWAAFFLSGEP
jgi:CHAT domain-containing protein/tetratricopeptide (TPR) repeat protein